MPGFMQSVKSISETATRRGCGSMQSTLYSFDEVAGRKQIPLSTLRCIMDRRVQSFLPLTTGWLKCCESKTKKGLSERCAKLTPRWEWLDHGFWRNRPNPPVSMIPRGHICSYDPLGSWPISSEGAHPNHQTWGCGPGALGIGTNPWSTIVTGIAKNLLLPTERKKGHVTVTVRCSSMKFGAHLQGSFEYKPTTH